MTVITDEKIKALFSRGVGELIDPDGSFVKKLKESPEKVVIKFGVDPTRPDIHLGHAVVLKWLRKLQDMGCKVIFLVGDFTSLIGDPTGKNKMRPELSQMEIINNMKTYLNQVGRILEVKKDEAGNILETDTFAWIGNSDWYVSIHDFGGNEPRDLNLKLQDWIRTRMQKNKSNIRTYSFINILSVLRKITHGRLIERDMFQDRIKSGEAIFMHEMLYPVIQGIDSKAIHDIYGACDLEVGGTDQHFNMLVGRDVLRMNENVPQAVLAFTLLEGLDGKEKMSKSLDNYVGITESPDDMFIKLMTLPDRLIVKYFILCTDVDEDEIRDMEVGMQNGENPIQYKKRLSQEIIKIYHSKAEAQMAQENWEKKVSSKIFPKDAAVEKLEKELTILDWLVMTKNVSSKAEGRRLINEGGVKIVKNNEEEKIVDPSLIITETVNLKIGKKKFLTILK